MNQNDHLSSNMATGDRFIKQNLKSGRESNSGGNTSIVSIELADDSLPANNISIKLKTAMLLQNGRVITWGKTRYDTQEVPPSIAEFAESQGIVSLSATHSAFAALQADGRVST
ncbi:hypothetical protein [Photorhabdus stackebrandtii]|uniref:hypothetical protein n=1 Tax=Photorhabdus stackebrandtii TaxID=1123042 RepID=UPI001F60F76E|nr:hypothetical protein [Photorhabdus stackebrandtii]